MDTIGKRVKQLRTARHLTQEQLAGLIGVKQSAISQIENGQTSSLSGDVLAGLCQHLVSTPSYILSGGAASDSNAAVKLAELSSLAQGMSDRALDSLLMTARALTMADPKSATEAALKPSDADERPVLAAVPASAPRAPARHPPTTQIISSGIKHDRRPSKPQVIPNPAKGSKRGQP